MLPGATAVDPGIRRHRVVEVFVPEKLSHNFESAGLIIEKNFRAQMTSLVWRQRYACLPSCIFGDPRPFSSFEVPSTLTNSLVGIPPMIFGMTRSRYSTSILTTCSGISKARSMSFLTSALDNSSVDFAPRPVRMNRCLSKLQRQQILQTNGHVS
jgi:hypothetical protein